MLNHTQKEAEKLKQEQMLIEEEVIKDNFLIINYI